MSIAIAAVKERNPALAEVFVFKLLGIFLAMLLLNDIDLIGKGAFRECYIHPEDRSKCVKILIEHRNWDWEKEVVYLEKVRKWKSDQILFYSDYYGQVETDKGTGYVFDLVRDENENAVSETLSTVFIKALASHDTANLIKIKAAIKELQKRMQKYRVVARDMHPGNLCCQRKSDGTFNLVLVDGVGHRHFLPLIDYISFLRKYKIRKYMKRLQDSLFMYRRAHDYYKVIDKVNSR